MKIGKLGNLMLNTLFHMSKIGAVRTRMMKCYRFNQRHSAVESHRTINVQTKDILSNGEKLIAEQSYEDLAGQKLWGD
eukprot:10719231-Heterocapsa_arctica.AAC.1